MVGVIERPAPTGLPVELVIPEVKRALTDRGCALLQAPPGAGKTTVVPLRLLGEPWLDESRIVILEPRKLAARAAARRMADLLDEPVGRTVGYRTRDDRKVSSTTRIEVVTEGILTRRIQRDPSLEGIGLVVFDEIHERNLPSDLGLALALEARDALRPDLRLLAMSATLDVDRVASALTDDHGPPPIVASAGRSHPVAIRWHPPDPRHRPDEVITSTVLEAMRSDPGDVLMFLAGAADIRRTCRRLEASVPPDTDVRPLFGALPPAEQDAALAPSPPGRRRVVVATDIAESSLTVEGVRIVIDAGLVRRPQFDGRTGITRLRTVPSSIASADQRAGRAGRIGPGVAHRLWSEAEHARRDPYPRPEITVADLTALTLELAVWGTRPAELRLVDQPPQRALGDAARLLRELRAVDDDGRVTPLGRRMVELPVHPRLARMILDAPSDASAAVACAIAVLVETRERTTTSHSDRSTDVAERIAPIVAGDRRWTELLKRAGIRRPAGEQLRDVHPGPLLAAAYPDRIAIATGGGRFRLRSGEGAWLPADDPLASEPFLAVADLEQETERGHRIRLAAGLDADDVETIAGADITTESRLTWDAASDDLCCRSERRLDAMVLSATDEPPEPSPATTDALVDHVDAVGLGVLRWPSGARALQARIGFIRSRLAGDWPDVSDGALLADLESWLAPRLIAATRRADLERLDMAHVLRQLLDHRQLGQLDRLAPTRLALPHNRSTAIDYSGEQPAISVRVQEVFGLARHPAVADGSVPVVVHLLSPAGRPVQVTADLPGFWDGSWHEVRKEMAGRYPKHDWPERPGSQRS
jgi:ATP-dependent helicase HrpB